VLEGERARRARGREGATTPAHAPPPQGEGPPLLAVRARPPPLARRPPTPQGKGRGAAAAALVGR
jgi:hypothetical protein